eukprot:TRINITY_DN39387_c0_g1_i1.p1 TRINITY_DN39387_c0_g1~~TRINITY_DN39387_c0_g1_i1.p1  ORF type:complete len:479 (+),score=161.14 TRINITY_DN39387_c0_g1_i1:43-1437(+)
MASDEDLTKLSVAELKKKLFWAGGALPSGGLEKEELLDAVKKALAEKAEQAQQAEQRKKDAKFQEAEQGVPRPEPRELDFDQAAASERDKEIIELHLLSESELRERIEKNGHDIPDDCTSKHYLVALCRKAMKNPQAVKPKKPKPKPEDSDDEGNAATALQAYRRPTVGDRVEVKDTMIMKRYCPTAIGKVFRIFKDDGGATPYRLAGIGEQRHWFSEADVCWPTKVEKTWTKSKVKARPDNQPNQILISFNRYGCTQGEVRDVTGETADKKSWILKGGRQVPKSHEGSGWTRVEAAAPDGVPPPPPPSGPEINISEAEMFAQMEEMQAQMEADALKEAAAVGAAVVEAASTVPDEAEKATPPPPPPSAPAAEAASAEVVNPPSKKRKASAGADTMDPEAKAAAGAAAAAAGAAAREARKRRALRREQQRQKQTSAEVLSDDDEVCAVDAKAHDASVSLEEEVL